MSVILSDEDFSAAGKDDKCSVCGEHLYPPYVFWWGESDLYFCGKCCCNLRTGLVADLIHVTAIEDLYNATGCYYGLTFKCENKQDIDRQKKQEREGMGLSRR
jgi:hypothetical protein